MLGGLLARFEPGVRRTVAIDVAATALVAACHGIVNPFAGLILRREFDATPLQLSIGASASAVSLLLSLVWARLSAPHVPLRWVVWPGVIARGLFVLTPISDSAWTLTLLCAVSGFVVTMTGPANVAFVERVYPRAVRGRALGIIRAAGGVATVLVSLVSGALLERLGYRAAFAGAAGVGVLGTLLLLRIRVPALDIPESPAALPGLRPEPRAATDRAFTSLMIASFTFGVGCWIQVPARTVTLADVVRITPRELGWLGGMGALCLIACSVGWGRFTDRRSSLDALRLVYLAGAVATVFYLVADTVWGLVGAAVADAVLQSGLDVIWTLALLDVVGSRGAARGAAVSATLAGVRGVLAPLLGAAIIEGVGVDAVYVVALVLMASGIALLGRVGSSQPAHDAGAPASAASLVR